MILNILVILLVGLIAFFHYVQGLFSATISAIIAIIAAILAVSYHETVVNTLLKGKMADQADAMVLCVLFAVIYIVLRLIFDAAVPGNVRFPTLVDKIGSAVMGLIAGIFATGIFALAAQALPFGPTVGMYSRFALKDKQGVIVPTGRQAVDSYIYDELNGETFDPAHENSLLIPVDDIVLSTVQRASDGGSLAGDVTFNSIHPDYPEELFGNRVGIQIGAKHSAMNLGATQAVTLQDVFNVSEMTTSDPEFKGLREGRKLDATVRPKANQMLLVFRIQIDKNAADDVDNIFRFSTGSMRLVANGKDYYPIGTVDNANLLYMQKPDDFIFLDDKNGQADVDVAYLVDKSDITSNGGKGASGPVTLNDGVFLEVKRLAQIDLSGKAISDSYSASPAVSVMRKQLNLDGRTAVTPVTPSAPSRSKPARKKGDSAAGKVFQSEQDIVPPVVAPF